MRMPLEEYIEAAIAKDPEGFEGISERDRILYIANGVKDPARIKEYVAEGIPPSLAGDMELEESE